MGRVRCRLSEVQVDGKSAMLRCGVCLGFRSQKEVGRVTAIETRPRCWRSQAHRLTLAVVPFFEGLLRKSNS
jgi:hypothetical protein